MVNKYNEDDYYFFKLVLVCDDTYIEREGRERECGILREETHAVIKYKKEPHTNFIQTRYYATTQIEESAVHPKNIRR